MAVEQTIDALDAADRVTVLGSLRRDEGGPERFAASLAEAHVGGMAVDWAGFYAGTGARRVDLPTYAFQRQSYWPAPGATAGDVTAAGLSRLDHPVLAAAVPVGDRDECLLTGRLALDSQAWMQDHAVFGTVILPGAALVELALTAGRHTGCPVVDELVLEAPLVLAEDEAAQVQVVVGAPDDAGRREVAIYSRPEAGEDDEREATCHARGMLAADAEPAAPFPATWPPAGARPVPVEGLYPRLADAGYDYGSLFQSVRSAWRNGAEVYTEIAVPEGAEGFAIHPALLDGALHGGLLDKEAGSTTDLPFSWSGVRVTAASRARARVRMAPAGESAVRVDVVGEQGEPVATVDRLASRPVDPSQLDTARGGQRSLFQVEWTAVTAGAGSASLAVLGDLPAPGERYADLDALERALADGALVPDAVVTTVEPAGDGMAGAHATAERVLGLLQRWLASEELADARLVVVTHRGVAVGDEAADLAVSPVWGLVRSAQSEHPGRFLLVDVDDGEPDWAGLADVDEPQLAVREGRLLAPRLTRVPAEQASDAWRLGIERKGSLEDLAVLPSDGDRPLGTREVRVGVRAAGLNFRDVLIALGLYPGDAPLGSEAAGVVLEVGAEVTDLAPGDRVLGLVPDAFGPVAVTDRRMVVPMPAGFTFAQAAAVPVVYLTAYYGLVELAGLGAGERVLVHAAAGGVGMAAVQLARHLGAEVYATASPAKWDAVQDLGVPQERIASSRDLAFRDRFREVTGGAGVDVVLNALAGEFIDASLDLLGSGGRFIEMGKADLRDPAVVAADHAGVRYRSYDLFEAGPDRIQQMLTEVVALFEAGVLTHSPTRTWDVRRGAEAFRFLREGRNTGKIVLTVPAPLDPDGTVLITGGTGGLGALVARHLVERHGARRLLLVSRRGLDAPGAQELVAELEKLDAQVRVAPCDVADRDQLAGLLGSLEHPLTAVVHSAGVLDDGVVEALTPERLERVMRPKIDAAGHLHELTAGIELSAFVLFSSVAALIGSPGQGNYAAANAYLDALAATRRAQGLPATSLAWGLWADATGMTGELDEAELARLARQGIDALPSELGLELFDQARQVDAALLAPVLLDLGGLRAQARAGMLPALLRGLVRAPARRSEVTGASLAERLAGMPRGDWERVTLDLVRGQVAAVLGHASPDAIEPDRAFKELGFDSLAAVELRNRLTQATGLRLPTTLVFDHPNSVAVAQYLIPIAVPAADAGQPASEEDEIRGVLASIPIARLRAAGLLDALVELARGDAEDTPPDSGDAASIDEMDIEDLIRMTEEDVA
ncbi:MAG: SDR family NAD(P)-dependent oxidoreductase, partial [Mycobacteriales bacterium]